MPRSIRSLLCTYFLTLPSLTFGESLRSEQPSSGWSAEGEIRGRFESLDGQFRAGRSGKDQLLLFRTLAHGRYQFPELSLGFEFQDSRTYLSDEETPLSNSFTNTVNLLQAYLELSQLPGLLPQSKEHRLTLGRQTISIGSKRQIERVSFANVIKSYTGLYSMSRSEGEDELHVFYVVPIERLPKRREEVEDNRYEFDQEQWERRLWGLHYRKAHLFGTDQGPIWGELFAYGLDERDTNRFPTPNRHYITSGFRFFRAPDAGKIDFDVEAAHRIGSRRAGSDPDDRQNLDVDAQMLLLRWGYTWNSALRPNLALQYYFASGDEDPGDDEYNQFERLFGGRRTDLNNTSLHGPLTPANLSAAGLRLTLTPAGPWDFRLHYSAAYLDSKTDSFIIAKYRDPTGSSGSFLGHALDSRLRYWTQGKRWMIEAGASTFVPGEFLEKSRQNEGLDDSATRFGYLQLTRQLF